jgi:hypothetical protein
MQIVKVPRYSHAKRACYLCLGVGSRGLIDTGMQIQGEGVLAICVTCVEKMGRLVGLAPPRQVSHWRERVEHLEGELKRIEAELAAAKADLVTQVRMLDHALEREKTHECAPRVQAQKVPVDA